MKLVKINEKGARIGDDHQNAKYSDGEVEQVLALRESGLSLGEVARRMDMPKSTVRDVCNGRRRCQTPVAWRRVP